MAKPQEHFLKTGGNDFDLTQDQIGDSFKVCYQYGWSLQPTPSIVPSTATYTVQVSDDNIKWDNYRATATDVNIDNPGCDTHINFLYIRVITTSNGALGTAQFKLVLKNG